MLCYYYDNPNMSVSWTVRICHNTLFLRSPTDAEICTADYCDFPCCSHSYVNYRIYMNLKVGSCYVTFIFIFEFLCWYYCLKLWPLWCSLSLVFLVKTTIGKIWNIVHYIVFGFWNYLLNSRFPLLGFSSDNNRISWIFTVGHCGSPGLRFPTYIYMFRILDSLNVLGYSSGNTKQSGISTVGHCVASGFSNFPLNSGFTELSRSFLC